jgi:catabolite repression HPr-like protein
MEEPLRRQVKAPVHLWMRNAAQIVRCIHRFHSDVRIGIGSRTEDGKSMMGILTLAIQKGQVFFLEASGTDAASCLSAIEECVNGMKDPIFAQEEDAEMLPTPTT